MSSSPLSSKGKKNEITNQTLGTVMELPQELSSGAAPLLRQPMALRISRNLYPGTEEGNLEPRQTGSLESSPGQQRSGQNGPTPMLSSLTLGFTILKESD